MIKYLGSKRTLIPQIIETVRQVGRINSATDLFSGTARVGHALKKAGFQVHSNDHNAYAATLARAYVQSDLETTGRQAEKIIPELNKIKGEKGYFTETFCEQSRFFQPHNGVRIDAIREHIEKQDYDENLKAVLLVSLMEAADRVDSTTGVQMAYLKNWAKRSYNDLQLRMPDLIEQPQNGPCQAYQMEAIDAATHIKADLTYLDPPYNQHKYLGNYHIWESLVLWDKPEVYGIACKRVDCRTRKSIFNSKPQFHQAMKDVIDALSSAYLVVSFNNEGYITRQDMEEMLSKKGVVQTLTVAYKRYVGAQIGIHNQKGQRVGEVSHLDNKEFIFVVTPEAINLKIAAA